MSQKRRTLDVVAAEVCYFHPSTVYHLQSPIYSCRTPLEGWSEVALDFRHIRLS